MTEQPSWQDLLDLVAQLNESNFESAAVSYGNISVTLSNSDTFMGGAAPAAAPAAPVAAAPTPAASTGSSSPAAPAAPAAPTPVSTAAAPPNHLPDRIRMLADISQKLAQAGIRKKELGIAVIFARMVLTTSAAQSISERARLNPLSSDVPAVRSLRRNATGSAFAAAATALGDRDRRGPLGAAELAIVPVFLALRWAVQAWYFADRIRRADRRCRAARGCRSGDGARHR